MGREGGGAPGWELGTYGLDTAHSQRAKNGFATFKGLRRGGRRRLVSPPKSPVLAVWVFTGGLCRPRSRAVLLTWEGAQFCSSAQAVWRCLETFFRCHSWRRWGAGGMLLVSRGLRLGMLKSPMMHRSLPLPRMTQRQCRERHSWETLPGAPHLSAPPPRSRTGAPTWLPGLPGIFSL